MSATAKFTKHYLPFLHPSKTTTPLTLLAALLLGDVELGECCRPLLKSGDATLLPLIW